MDFDFDPFDGDHDWFDAVIIGSCIDSLAAEELENEDEGNLRKTCFQTRTRWIGTPQGLRMMIYKLRNPHTGKNMMLRSRRVVTFQCSGRLRDKIK